MPITARHDPDVDALYVRLREAPIKSSVKAFGLVIDLDAQGQPVGVEAINLPLRWQQLTRTAAQFGLDDQLGEIWDAVARALPTPASRTRRSGVLLSFSWEQFGQKSIAVGASRVSLPVLCHEYGLAG